ncbi:hypothetical protein SUGI_0194600 [Cryptomeria japonica]|nr:hypothetical protein SUGI_0194600 [Cryptomeria japonica]
MSLEVTQILLNAQSVDDGIRKLAEENLKQFQDQNLPAFLISLSHELANNEKPIESRRLAGLILKNCLDAKEAHRKAELVQGWRSLEASVKTQIKEFLLQTLNSPARDAGHTSGQVIAKIAGIELKHGEWPQLIKVLLANAEGSQPAHLRQSTLETLGFVCEEVSSDSLAQDEVNSILTAVVQGMNSNSPEDGGGDVRLAATRALYNALDFAQTNFDNDMERDYIMSVEIFTITARAVREDEEPVALQAVEFWSSICDEEIDILEMFGDDFDGDSEEAPCFHFIRQALPSLVPMLLETLLKQEEDLDQDEEAWNLAMAGGTCLGLVARTVGDDVVPLVMPFVEENISKPDWRCREAATYAFGSILEGPSAEKVSPLVSLALGFMLNAMKDQNNHVKDTTAWTLSRIFEFLHGSSVQTPIVTQSNLPLIVSVLLESMKDVPNVAEKVCGALYFLAQGYEDAPMSSSPLSPFFQNIVQSLLSAAHREDAVDSKLRTSAYETLNEVVRCSTEETTPIVMQLVPVILMKLNETLEVPKLSSEGSEKQNELQALLCGCLQVIIQKLGALESTKYGVLQYADQTMNTFLRIFSSRSATVHEEAMLAIGALAYAVGVEFGKYMQEFYRYLEMGLQNFEEYQVCAITIGVVGDVCRALDDKVLPYCDGIMTQLLKDLSSDQLHRSVKPSIFSCFGDIALAIGEHFEKYLGYAMPMLQRAAELSVHSADQEDELIEYTNQLRNGILEAYSGIFQGFKNSSKKELLLHYASHILQFLESIYQDKDRDDVVTKAAIGVLGDLADTLGANAAPLLRRSVFYKDFINDCLLSDDPRIQETAEWVKQIMSQVLSG